MNRDAAPLRGIVLCHGEMATGLVDAVRRIADAPADALVALSNTGLGPEDIAERVSEAIGDARAIVFTDLQAGSCGFAARRLCLGRSDLYVISGVNLPLLIDFVLHRDMPLPALVERLLERGRSGIAAIQPAPSDRHGDPAVPGG